MTITGFFSPRAAIVLCRSSRYRLFIDQFFKPAESSMSDTDQPLWTPSDERIANSNLTEFARMAANNFCAPLGSYAALHGWSIDRPEEFWSCLWDYADIIGERGDRNVAPAEAMPDTQFFPDASLNFAENLLRHEGDEPAILFQAEDQKQTTMTRDELRALVSRLQQALRASGVGRGDRVAAITPNMPETLACMLAVSSLGAIWSSCSPDFGEQGILDRFGQIEPKVLIACDGYWYNGKAIDIGAKVEAVLSVLQPEATILLPLLDAEETVQGMTPLAEFIEPYAVAPLEFERLPFSHPLYILFSSGTTGAPKCIVHSQGGCLLQHIKEHVLHCDIRQGDRVFYFTTCGWMMWNWLVSGLAAGATLVLYDGSPFYPSGSVLFDMADRCCVTFFGTSAKFIDALRNAGIRPADTHHLKSIRTIASTGSTLSPENFRFAYDGIKRDVHLASVSGGTDIVACFVSAVPWHPVYEGEIQGAALGMATDVWDEEGRPVEQQKGELVCTRAFPSMPIGFWNDPDGVKYHQAYFERFENVWCHGDFAEWTEHGGMIIHGRSDATLNPGGVRIGTAEIYNQVEQLEAVEEALCIGQEWESDTRVVLFVRLREGLELTDQLTQTIKHKIRTGASPRHVPAVVVQVADIPRTKSGKITELAVREIVHGRPVKNEEALANPQALRLYENIPQLQI